MYPRVKGVCWAIDCKNPILFEVKLKAKEAPKNGQSCELTGKFCEIHIKSAWKEYEKLKNDYIKLIGKRLK